MVEVTGSSPVRITKTPSQKRRHSLEVKRYLGMVKTIGSIPIDGSEKRFRKSSKKFGGTKRITNFVKRKQKRSLT